MDINTELLELEIAIKHGRHNQLTHGRRTGRRIAYQETYRAVRNEGLDRPEARAKAKARSAEVAITESQEREARRATRLLERAQESRRAAVKGRMTAAQSRRAIQRAQNLEARAIREPVPNKRKTQPQQQETFDEFSRAYKAKVRASHERVILQFSKELPELRQRLAEAETAKAAAKPIIDPLIQRRNELLKIAGNTVKHTPKERKAAEAESKKLQDQIRAITSSYPSQNERARLSALIAERDSYIEQLSAELRNLPERPLGWPSTAVAFEAKQLRERITAARPEFEEKRRNARANIEAVRQAPQLTRALRTVADSSDELRRQDLSDDARAAFERKRANAQAVVDEYEGRIAALKREYTPLALDRYVVPYEYDSGMGVLREFMAMRINPLTARLKKGDANIRNDVMDALNKQLDEMKPIVTDRLTPPKAVDILYLPGNDYRPTYAVREHIFRIARPKSSAFDWNVSYKAEMTNAVWHEMGHGWDAIPSVRAQTFAMYERRTLGNPLFMWNDENNSEPTRLGFPDNYTGKEYRSQITHERRATEITAMGLEYMRDPAAFIRRDPDHFDMIFSLMLGDFE